MAELDPSNPTAPARIRSAGNADAGSASGEADIGKGAAVGGDPGPDSERNAVRDTATGNDTATANDTAATNDTAAGRGTATTNDTAAGAATDIRTDADAGTDIRGDTDIGSDTGVSTDTRVSRDADAETSDDAKDHTLAGYIAQHGRPPAFEGSDSQPYTVDVDVDETNDPERPYAAFLVFLRWAGNASGVMEHLESGDVAYDQSDTGARRTALALSLYQVKAELDAAIERRHAERGW